MGPDELFNINGFHWSLLFSVQWKKHFRFGTFLSCTQNSITRWTWHEIIIGATIRSNFGYIPEIRVHINYKWVNQKWKLNYSIDFIENGQITDDRELSKRIFRLMPKILVRILLDIFWTHINDTKIILFCSQYLWQIINNERESPRARSIANPRSNVYIYTFCARCYRL